MTEELKNYFRDLDFAVATHIDMLEAKYKRKKAENEIIHKLMRMKYIEKRNLVYINELKCIPTYLIFKVYDRSDLFSK